MDTLYILYRGAIIALLACLAQVKAVQVTAQMTSTGVTGNNATLVCSWVPDSNDILFILNIKSVSRRNYYTYFIGRDNQPQPQDSPQRDRLSVDSTTQDSTSVTMRITGLVCDDEQIYQCQVEYNYLSGATPSNQAVTKNASLTIRVPPAPPVMDSTSPSNLTGGVAEYSVVTFTCSGNIGKPGPGSVIWKLFRGSVDEELLPTDNRVTTTDVSPLPVEATCSQRKRSVLTMNVSRSDQDLVVACFVRNNGFSPSGSPTTCEDNTSDLCVQTETIRIHYGVKSASASRDPQSDLYEGSQVTLRCSAEGFPAPTYTWFKVGEEDNILSSSTNGQYTITNLNDTLHGGEYICNASNTVFGVTYVESDRVNIAVLQTTTPPPTTTPEPTPSTEKSKEQTSGDDDDDTTTIIIVVVVVVVVLVIIAIVGVVVWKKRRPKKEIEEPPEKPYNNRTHLAHPSAQPDLVADDKKFHNPSLNNSFDYKNEDGLMYADLTYDNRPRSRKPMAIGDTASEYSDIQMPQV